MPRVVPSQVVSFIDGIPSQQNSDLVRMNSIGAANLSAVLDLVEQIPDELLTMDKEAYGSLVRAKATIREILSTCRAPAPWTALDLPLPGMRRAPRPQVVKWPPACRIGLFAKNM